MQLKVDAEGLSKPAMDHTLADDGQSVELLDQDHKPSQQMHIADDTELHSRAEKPSALVIGIVLAVTIFGFTVQTEATAYYQEVLGWPKPFASLFLTHSCLVLPWLVHQLFFSRKRARQGSPWLVRQVQEVADLAATADAYPGRSSGNHDHPSIDLSALRYLLTTMAIVTVVMTISGVAWFTALSMTTPSDLTVIYNCSAFFAAIFSVPLLHERLTRNVVLAVVISFAGTLMIAYGSGSSSEQTTDKPGIGASRVAGNLIAMIGACAYGLYCVLFKKWTTSSRHNDAMSSMRMTFAASGLTGLYTISLFWVLLLVLHFTGVETLTLPSPQVCFYVLISVVPGSVSMTFAVVLTAWTNPVFGSVASILCVFFVAMADWMLFGILPTLSTYVGGALIFFAFGLLSWDESVR